MSAILLSLVAAACLTVALIVETSSWWVRAQAPAGAVGLYVSRSNIYLYGGRFFSLAFASLTAFWIERGATPVQVSFLLAQSLALAAVTQLILLHWSGPFKWVMRCIAFGLRLPPPKPQPQNSRRKMNLSLFFSTMASALVFGVGLGLPLLVAVLIPEYRLSVSYIGQVLNSMGTLVTLLLVDQILFRSLDAGDLSDDVTDYGRGRICGFLFAGMLFFIAALVAL